ncbi:facilitated trehalose transporter Tret1-like [Pectinophora gossypiella]|uniref:facilitated trehalose transporter Tret1-like n=1 Tax=Pectinophora gossypiella TaxID=13191 RepID=UPI00214F44E0|nr:facilitated trehalose transporter Tret1-like [Pectinophora gossypiella]
MNATKGNLSQPKKGHTYRQWFVAILANTTLMTYGLQAGWVSPMTKVLQSEDSPTGHALEDSEISWIASIVCLAAVAGVPLYSYMTDKFGRKISVIAIAVFQAICWLIKFSSANTATLIAARVCSGLAAGGCFIVIPIYVNEISQDDIRGLTGSLLMMCQNIGILTMYALGAYVEYFKVLWIVSWLPIMTIVLMLKAPESPAFLIKVGRTEEATLVLSWLRGVSEDDKTIQNEVIVMNNDKLYFQDLPSISFLSMFKNQAWRREILLMGAIMTVCSTNGCFTILTYANALLASSGVTFSPEMQTLSFPAVMIVAALLSMSCVERLGRKPLLALSLASMMCSMVGMGAIILVQHQGSTVLWWLPVVMMMLSVASYAAGAGPVPYIMMSEMFNFQIRAQVLGFIVAYSWFVNFLQLLAYAPISNAVGMHTTFFFFGAINCLGFCIALVLLPETKGKSVEEIEAKFRNK